MRDNQYDTVPDALKAAKEKNFNFRFTVENGSLRCLETNDLFSPADLTLKASYHAGGVSDPNESLMVYLLQTSSGIKGTLTDTYANPEVLELIKKIQRDQSGVAGAIDGKRCLNCGAPLSGPYCAQCGQKDEHLHEPFWKLAGHFIGDLFHFDSKFIHTMVPLLFRPGFLTNEFISGRRKQYMQPVPLYIFLSAVFFILLFLVNNPAEKIISGMSTGQPQVQQAMDSLKAEMQKDSTLNAEGNPADSILDKAYNPGNLHLSFNTKDSLPATVEAYHDSILKLPASDRPGWLRQFFDRKQIELQAKDSKEVIKELVETATHNIPKLMFFLLPVFALVLKLVYVRRKIYLVDHGIFTLHYHSFVFIFFTVLLL
ncbi:MAG TPA: DUF3667 domain-containing protein, partial [Puia sp.]|nr:DUF3667 domain-containing protein [Puia sp.]